jgi:hypothetical protein
MQMVARSTTSMSINSNLWAKVPVWQGFSDQNRFNFHRVLRSKNSETTWRRFNLHPQ